jgi:HEPN domain-containing protein
MYNLLISADQNSWEGPPFEIDLARCIREYTDREIVEKYQHLTEAIIRKIKRLPCLFAYETQCEKAPKFGLIRNVLIRRNLVSIEYDIIDLEPFLTYQDLTELSFRLDINGWELSRTHWAIKNINLAEELYLKGITLPQGITRDSKSVDITKHIFEVSLSFPGDFRNYVESVARHLERHLGPNAYFYDNNYKAQLARPSLDVLLQEIYRDRSKLIVVFIGEKYQEKEWCGVEFRAIKDIIFNKRHDRIMFVRMDHGKVDGIFRTDGYIDATMHEPEEIAGFIVQRIDLLG